MVRLPRLLLILSCIFPRALGGQALAFDEAWRWARYTTESGLPSAAVYDFVEAEDGYWVASDGGLAWYDGFEWHTVNTAIPAGLFPTALEAMPGGGVLATVHGIPYRVTREGARSLGLVFEGSQPVIAHAVSLGDSSVLALGDSALTVARLLLWDGSEATLFPQPGTTPWAGANHQLAKTADGRIWTTTNRGLFRLEGREWIEVQAAEGPGYGISTIASSGSLVAFAVTAPAEQAGLWEYDGRSLRRRRSEGTHRILMIDAAPEGRLTAIHETGDIRIRESGGWRMLAMPPDETRSATFIRTDSAGDSWVGTPSGLYRYRRSSRRWANWHRPFGDLRNQVRALESDISGRVWVGSRDGVEIRDTRGVRSRLPLPGAQTHRDVQSLARDSAGGMWVVLQEPATVLRWNRDASWTRFGAAEGLTALGRVRVRVAPDGGVWVTATGLGADGAGLWSLDGSRFVPWRRDGVPDGAVHDISVAADGTIWLSETPRLSRYRDGAWRQWTRSDGLRGSADFVSVLDDEGRPWLGSPQWGLAHVDARDSLEYFTTEEGLIDNRVVDLAFGPEGRLWVATDNGLSLYHEGVWTPIGPGAGLPNPHLSALLPGTGAVVVASRGAGTSLLSLDEASMAPPHIVLGRPVVQEAGLFLTWRAHAGNGAIPEGGIFTRFRLDAGPWSRWGLIGEASLQQIDPGEHTFTVQSRGVLGSVRPEGTSVTFAIPFPIYLRPVFVVPVALLTLAVIVLSATTAVRRRKHEAVLRREVKGRTAAEGELADRLDFEEMVFHLSTDFVGMPASQIVGSITDGLALLAQMLDADRGYVYRLAPGAAAAHRTHVYHRAGLKPEEGLPDVLGAADFPWVLDRLMADEPVFYRRGMVIPDGARGLARALEHFGTRGLVLTPFAQNTPEQGCIVLSVATRDPEWTEETASSVRLVGEVFANALSRARAAAERSAAEEERILLEAQLRQAQKLETVGQLTGGIAHDFNNLLTVIIGNLEMLGMEPEIDGEARSLAANALAAADRGATLTQRLLAFARRQALQPRSIVASKLLEGMGDLLMRTLGEDIRIEVAVPDALWLCRADPSQLEQAILNLAINARDAMPAGGRLVVECANLEADRAMADAHPGLEPGQYVCIAVTDTGTGMPEGVAAKAFDPFFTTKEVGRGSGLGLSMVYGFARQSGGYVSIYSEPGQGTTVRTYLPRSVDDAEDIGVDEPAPAGIAGEGRSVLVVEDDPGVRQLLTELLSRMGFQVNSVEDGRQAVQILTDDVDFDLLLSDVVLPGGLTGLAVADHARSLTRPPAILFTSGYTEHQVLQGARLSESEALLEKPFTRATLIEKLQQVLPGR
jgi:signal transduction histidine kinase/CheY-like chemotaxis protein/ligand-binding sensor domain-containing protein